MDRERLKDEMRREALEIVDRVCAEVPDSLRCFRQVERALKEAMQELQVKYLQRWCDEAKDDSSRPLCPHCGGQMRQKDDKDRQIICHGGDVVVKRKRWWCERCGESFFPSGRSGDGGMLADKP